MGRLRSYSEKISYNINIIRLIETIYYSTTRDIAREFISLETLEDMIFNQPVGIEQEILQKMSLGFDYLYTESKENFINMGYDDEDYIKDHSSLSNVAHALLSNLLSHFSCALALLLLETTDIEEFLSFSIRLSVLSKYGVEFTYRE